MDENRQNQPVETGEQAGEEKKHKLLEFREEEKEKKFVLTDKMKKEIREWIVSLAGAVIVVLLIRTFLFTIIRVDGPSMSDTLLNGDKLFVTVADMKLNGPDRFDVVICKYPDKRDNYVKRVIGLPGETLEVKKGVLYINGEAIEEPFLSALRTERYSKISNNFGPVVIGEDEYFVMGDNRDNSNDSRNVGVITGDMVVGKVRQIIWPLNRFSSVPGAEEYAQ